MFVDTDLLGSTKILDILVLIPQPFFSKNHISKKVSFMANLI